MNIQTILAGAKYTSSRNDPDYAAYYARVLANSSDLSTAEKTAAETLIIGLKAASHWSTLTSLFLFIGDDANAAKTYVVGGNDCSSSGTVDLFDGTGNRYRRSTGFYRDGASQYESRINFGAGSSFNWAGSNPLTSYFWGRNSQVGARQGMHPNTGGGDQWSVPSYHEASFSGGWQLKARRADTGTQETGFGGTGIDTVSVGACAFDGTTGFAGRGLNSSDSGSGGTMTLSSAIDNVTSNFYLNADNPILGGAVFDGTEHSNAEMDAINILFKDFVEDCGLTMTAVDPDV